MHLEAGVVDGCQTRECVPPRLSRLNNKPATALDPHRRKTGMVQETMTGHLWLLDKAGIHRFRFFLQ